MNQDLRPAATSGVPWPTSDERARVPDTSMLPDDDADSATPVAAAAAAAAPAAVGMLKQAVQGAHETLDRFAERAEPAVRQMGDSVAAAEEALHEKAGQLRATGDEWAESLRSTVRANPLVAVAAAVVLGALISSLTRSDTRQGRR